MLDSGDFQKNLRNVSRPPDKEISASPTCHFKQPGLNEGLPAAASSSLINTYKLGSLVGLGVLCGSSFGGYVRTGTLSNSLFTGAGIENRFLTLLACCLKELKFVELGGLSPVPLPSLLSSGGIRKKEPSRVHLKQSTKTNKSLKLPSVPGTVRSRYATGRLQLSFRSSLLCK
jgi:hypothetical protein